MGMLVLTSACLLGGAQQTTYMYVMVQGRYSFVGAQPAMEVVARENSVTVIDHHTRQRTVTEESDPMEVRASAPTVYNPCSGHCCAVGHQTGTASCQGSSVRWERVA